MRKKYPFNEFGVCSNPNNVFRDTNIVCTIRVMTAQLQDKWVAGHQISIYTTGAEAVSVLKYPSKKGVKFNLEEDAIRFACLSIDKELANSIAIDPVLLYVKPIKNYLKTFGKKI